MCSCVVSVTYSAMLYNVFGGWLWFCVCLSLLTVLGCRACELVCDDACWLMCALLCVMCLFTVLCVLFVTLCAMLYGMLLCVL